MNGNTCTNYSTSFGCYVDSHYCHIFYMVIHRGCGTAKSSTQDFVFDSIEITCKCDLSNTFYFENDVQ